jgi:hypothetical protein
MVCLVGWEPKTTTRDGKLNLAVSLIRVDQCQCVASYQLEMVVDQRRFPVALITSFSSFRN